MRKYDVVGICNALVDILVETSDEDIRKLALRKGAMHLVEHSRQEEILSHFKSHAQTIELGGSSMNAIRTLAALGMRTCFAGMIGEDDFGSRIKNRMQHLGIKSHLGLSDVATGSCLILITPDGERTMNTCLGASRLYGKSQIPEEEIKNATLIHFCGYQWDTDGQKEAIQHAISIAKSHSTLISFDVSDPFVVERHQKDFLNMIQNDADIVFANQEESRILFEESPDEAAKWITDQGAIAVIKLGSKGALIRRGNEEIRVHPFPVQVVDTTAAGDMFAAGFLYGFLRDLSLERSGKIASFLAGDVIQRIGANISQSALGEVPLF